MGPVKFERPLRHTSDDIEFAVRRVALRGGAGLDIEIFASWVWNLAPQDWMSWWVEREKRRGLTG